MMLRACFLIFLFSTGLGSRAQKVDSIFVHLYTDSLKKGTYNYINIDGLLASGRYLPLDTNHVLFKTSHGKFFGNSLWIEPGTKEEKVKIEVFLKSNPSVRRDFTMYIKKSPDNGQLRTEQEIIDAMKSKGRKAKS